MCSPENDFPIHQKKSLQ